MLKIFTILLPVLFFCWSCDNNEIPDSLAVSSLAFSDGQVIPKVHTCKGKAKGYSPAIFIDNMPVDTAQVALIMENSDATDSRVTHWIIWGISARSGHITDNIPKGETQFMNYRQGMSDFDIIGYVPPCDPLKMRKKDHIYTFIAYAIDKAASDSLFKADPESVDRSAFDKLIKSHILAKGEFSGIFRF
jgi:Raf kinase inhibitor-like YbhB/YbcL family protein